MPLAVIRRLLPDWGTTYGPPDDTPRPAVLLLHGSEGGLSGWSNCYSAILGASGYLVYPHSYSAGGNAWNAGSIKDIDLSRTVKALEALRAFPYCNGRVALYGISRGAEHALLVATGMAKRGLGPLPDAVACLAPPDVVCGAFDARSYRDPGDPGWQAWDPAKRAWNWEGKYDDLLPTQEIGVETYPGPLFLAAGMKDTVWSPDMSRRLEQRRLKHNRPVEAHYYENEHHVPGSKGENEHHRRLLGFLERHLPLP
ncbi:alpha/beta hydrolase family protein [Roseibium litorale]|uniref:Alpha/beta hydrolase n=1 Tax=Roseibium litorale TaxID=2803841 RepID=A0ABR9CGZ6_9HYPH|nr:alpha/beta hydrolase [Roseibium litorale]MBD8890038.1 alpha/beta hydrolase [Roseibium litorale]